MTDPNCIFCNIASKAAQAQIEYESDNVVIFKDIMPSAPVHVQVISKRHIPTVNDITEGDIPLIGEMILAAKDYAKKAGIDQSGYKLMWNVGKEGGMVVHHLHMHLMGGKQLPEY